MIRPAFRFTLFGGPALERNGRFLPLSPLQSAVLALAAFHGPRGIRRDDLLGLLWPDGTDGQVRRRFSQLIYSLHRRVGWRVLTNSAERWAIDMTLVSTDLDDFGGLLDRGEVARAVDIVTRGFCSDFNSRTTWELEQWIAERDRQFRSTVRSLASELWDAGESEVDWGIAEAAAEAWIALDPSDERVLQRLLRAKALRGRVREAEARYADFCASAILEDPEWTPEPATSRILADLDEVAARRLGPASEPSTSFDIPLVGRSEALDLLMDSVTGTRSTGVRVIVVSGEAGIGKTRLVREVMSLLPIQGPRLIQGTSSEIERSVPLGSLARALATEWVGPLARGLGSPWQELLTGVLPHLWTAGVPSESGVSPEELPRLLLEAVHRLLKRIAEAGPVTLFLDDAHLMDDTSVSLLAYLGERWTGPGLSLVLALRPEEVPGGSSLGRWLDRGAPGTDVVRLTLTRLDGVSARALVAHAMARLEGDAADRRSSSEIDALAELSDGHPLLAIECALGGGTELLRHPHDRGPASSAVRRAVSARFGSLSIEARRLLVALSPHEAPLPFSLVESVSALPSDVLRHAFDEVVEGRFVEVSSAGVRFRHGLIREAIHLGLRPTERIEAHRSMAEALANASDPSLATDIALHFFAAAEPVAAAPHALAAAQAAVNAGGWAEARGILERTLEAGATGMLGARAAFMLARVAMLQGDFHRAERVSDIAEASFAGEGRVEEALIARLRGLEARALLPGSDRFSVLDAVRGVRARATEGGMRRVEAECMSAEVRILDGLRRVKEVRDLTREARSHRGAPDDARLKFLFVAMHDAVYGDAAGAAELADEAAEIAERAGDPNALVRALNWKVIALGNQALLNTTEGRALIERGMRVASEADDLEQKFHVHNNVAVWHMDAGEYDEAARVFGGAGESLASLAAPHLRRTLRFNLGQMSLELGQLESARAHFEQGLDVSEVSEHAPHGFVAKCGLGLVHLERGALDSARRVFESLQGSPSDWACDPLLWMRLRARLQVLSGDPMAALRDLRAGEEGLRGHAATTWMRIRLLRLELGLRVADARLVAEAIELENFMVSRGLGERLRELHRIRALMEPGAGYPR